MELYLSLRQAHIVCVIITASGFALRGVWMLTESPLLNHRLTRTLPHINDTLLLGAGVGMIWLAHLDPFAHTWLMAKLVGLVIYILLGSIALRRGRTKRERAMGLVGALLALGYIAAVALTRNPAPFWT